MITKYVRLLFLLGCVFISPLVATAKQPSLAASVPDGAIGFVELTNLGDVVRSIRESNALKQVLATDEYRKYEESQQYRQAMAFKAGAELILGSSLWDVASNVLGGRIAVAVYPNPENYRVPTAVAVLRPDEPKSLERVREVLKTLLGASGKEVDIGAVCPGTTTWSIKDQVFLTMHANWIAASQQRPLLERTLAILGGKPDKTSPLSAQENFAGMERSFKDDRHVRAWVNTPLIKKALGERFGVPKKSTDGMASLIFGGLLELTNGAPFAAGTLDFHKNDIEGTLAIAGEPAKLPEPGALWFTQYPANGVIPLPNTPGNVGGITIHRKLGQWYRQRENLLADHLLPAFDKFETDIGNLLPRKDFGQDVLPLIGDNFTFVSALQKYDHLGGEPGIKLPAFALIFDLPKPKEGADTFQLFFQTLSAILNLQAGQEGRQPSVLDAEIYKDTKIAFSRFLDKPTGDRLAIAYNFQPAAASIAGKYILSTSVQFCRDLIDHFKSPGASEWQNRNSEMIVDIGALGKLAEINESFIRSQDIQKGTPPDAAEKRVGLLVSLLKQFDKLRYYSSAESGLFKMNLKLGWK